MDERNPVGLEDIVQRVHLDLPLDRQQSGILMLAGQSRIAGRQLAARDVVEGDGASGVASGDRQVDVVGSGRDKLLMEAQSRFDVDSAPASFIERPGDRLLVRVVGPDIDIEAACDLAQRAVEDHVLQVLGKGDEGHQRSILMEGGTQAVPMKYGLSWLPTVNSRARSRHS